MEGEEGCRRGYREKLCCATGCTTDSVSPSGTLEQKWSYRVVPALSWNVVVVQSLSCVQLFATPWTAAHQASLSIINSQSLLKLMSIDLVMPSNHLILCCPLLLLPSPSPPALHLSQHQGLFQWMGSSHQVAIVLERQLQHQTFQKVFRFDFL